jgi:hypothetical protein
MTLKPSSLAGQFERSAKTFAALDASLYAALSENAAAELYKGTRFRHALKPFEDEPPNRIFPNRLFALVHEWVLAGQLPALARHYPTTGGELGPNEAWPLFRDAVIEREDDMVLPLARLHQHNEIGRVPVLGVGFDAVARRFPDLSWHLYEIGASAGLLLHGDTWATFWPDWCACQFDGPAVQWPSIDIEERLGCDLEPIDPLDHDSAMRLRSLIWADRPDLLDVLNGALKFYDDFLPAAASVEKADAANWLTDRLSLREGTVTVVFSSAMRVHASPESLRRIDKAIERAGEYASEARALAYVSFEVPPPSAVSDNDTLLDPRRMVQVRVRCWPEDGSADPRGRLVARSDINGSNIQVVP